MVLSPFSAQASENMQDTPQIKGDRSVGFQPPNSQWRTGDKDVPFCNRMPESGRDAVSDGYGRS